MRRHREPHSKINKNRSIAQYIIVKLANLRDKKKILKSIQDKRSVPYKIRDIKLAQDLSTETWQARKDVMIYSWC